LLPWLTGVGFLVLAAGLFWVWRHPTIPPPSTAQTDALARQVAALDERVNRLMAAQSRSPSPDLGPLTARVTALEDRPAAAPPSPAPDLGPLAARVAVLEQRTPPDLAPLEARISAMENAERTETARSQPPPDLGPLRARVAALEQRPLPPPAPDLGPITARIMALEQRQPPDLAPLEARVGALEKTGQVDDRRSSRIAAVQSAALALAAGVKLGDLPGAPPALARFANVAPPSEAALRLSFPAAARAAMAVAHPVTEGKPLLRRLWAEAQDLITIRQGEHVVVGDPTAGVLERARAALDAGDLAAATENIAALQGAAAQAMAGWLAQARALLAARAALAAWAAPG